MFDTEPTPHLPPAAPAAPEDSDLLRRYAETGAEDALAELVRRRIGLVYSVALRQTHGDRHRAEDATLAVFTDLARKARTLAQRPVLAGWLYRSAQFAAAGLVRAEQRRQAREQEAHTMETILAADSPPPDWEKARPVLDHALSELPESDRDAVLLRFFDQRPFAEIAARLRLTENAARMRVERALDKLNAALASRGITSSTAALTAALASHSTVAAPAGLAASVTGAALATTAGAGGIFGGMLAMSKLQLGAVAAFAVGGAAVLTTQAETNANLRREIAALQITPSAVAALRTENQRLASLAVEVEQLRHDDVELKQLAQSVTELQKTQTERTRLASLRDEQQRSDKAEVERMNREGHALVNEFRALSERAKDPAATPEARAEADAAAKQKLAAIRAKQREVQEFIANAKAGAPNLKKTEGSARVLRPPSTTNADSEEYLRPAPVESVSLNLPNADTATVFSAYELYSGLKIVRDPSLATAGRLLDLRLSQVPRDEALQALRTALRDQMNIVLEPTTDGRLLAKLAPPR